MGERRKIPSWAKAPRWNSVWSRGWMEGRVGAYLSGPENMPSTLAVTRVCLSIHSQLIYPQTLLPAISGNYRVKSGSSVNWKLWSDEERGMETGIY